MKGEVERKSLLARRILENIPIYEWYNSFFFSTALRSLFLCVSQLDLDSIKDMSRPDPGYRCAQPIAS